MTTAKILPKMAQMAADTEYAPGLSGPGMPCTPPMPHKGLITRAEFSQDGTRILTAGFHYAQVWDAQSGQPLTPPMKTSFCSSLSPDGRSLAVGDFGHGVPSGITVWSVETEPKVIAQIRREEPKVPHFLDFSPDGQSLLADETNQYSGWESPATVVAWDLSADRQRFSPIPLEQKVMHVEFSPSGTTFVTNYLDGFGAGRVNLWDANTGKEATPEMQHRKRVNCLAFDPAGKYLVTGDAVGRAQLWDTGTGQPASPPLLHKSGIRGIALGLNGQRIVTLTESLAVPDVLWEINGHRVSGRALCHKQGFITLADKFGCVALDPSARRVAATNNTDHESSIPERNPGWWLLFDFETGKPILPVLETKTLVRHIAFSLDGGKVVVACGRDGVENYAVVWDVSTEG